MPYLEFADLYMLSTIAKFHIEERAATIYKYIKKDTKTYPVMEDWTKKTVKRVWYLPDKNLDTGEGPESPLLWPRGWRRGLGPYGTVGWESEESAWAKPAVAYAAAGGSP